MDNKDWYLATVLERRDDPSGYISLQVVKNGTGTSDNVGSELDPGCGDDGFSLEVVWSGSEIEARDSAASEEATNIVSSNTVTITPPRSHQNNLIPSTGALPRALSQPQRGLPKNRKECENLQQQDSLPERAEEAKDSFCAKI